MNIYYITQPGYNDHGYNEPGYNEPGYNEPWLYRTSLASPELFVITEFDCSLKVNLKKRQNCDVIRNEFVTS